MMRLMFRLVVALIALLPAACGGARARPTAPARAAAEADYPALRWVAADTPYAVVATHAGDLAQTAAELIAAVGLFGDFDRGDADRALRGLLGASPLSRGELEDLGIDGDRSAAIFGVGGSYPAAMLPVAEPARVRSLLERLRPSFGLEVERFRGIDVYTYRDGGGQVSWAQLDGWLAVHVAPRTRGANTAWLAQILDVPAGRGLAAEPDLIEASKRVGTALGDSHGPGVLGLVRWERLVAGLPDVPAMDDCRPLVGARAMLGADVASDSARGAVIVELAPSLAHAFTRAFAPPPPAGYRALRAAAAIHGELDVDLRMVAGLFNGSGCPLAPRLSSRELASLGSPSVIGWRIAASDLRLDPPDGHVGLELALRDESFARDLLDQIPMRSVIESGSRVAGVDVRVIDVPLYPRLTYRLAGGSFTAAIGDGVIERMLGGSSGPAEPGRTVFWAGIWPGRLPGAGRILAAVAGLAGIRRPGYFERLGQRLERYDHGWARLSLQGDDLVLRLGMGLR